MIRAWPLPGFSFCVSAIRYGHPKGGLAEWSKAAVLKTVRAEMPSQVRILHPPPQTRDCFAITVWG